MTQTEDFLNVPLRINSFCVPFQVTIGGTKTFMGRGKNGWEGRATIMRKSARWRRLSALSSLGRPAAITITSRSLSPYETHSSFTKRTSLKLRG